MIKEFITAFKKAYSEAYAEKLAAKQAINEFKKLMLHQGAICEHLKQLNLYLNSCSTTVSWKDYLKYFTGLNHFLNYEFTENEDKTINLISNNGYMEKARAIYEYMNECYNNVLHFYKRREYALCIENIKIGLNTYNKKWKEINCDRLSVDMKCIDYTFKD